MTLEQFRTIILPLRKKLLVVAKKMLVSDEEAEDAVQEALIRVWQAKDRLADHPSVEGYTMLVLKNICLDKIRQRKINIPIEDIQLGSNSYTPHLELEINNSVQIVKQIIETLPKLQQLVITMRDVEEYELNEIAEITGTKTEAVKMNLSRARKKVRDTFIQIQAIKLQQR